MNIDPFDAESKPSIADMLNISITYPLSCTVCFRTFATLNNLQKHRKIFKHTEEMFPCTTDPNKKLSPLINENELPKPEDSFCDLCQKMFPSARRLRMHMKNVHTEDRPHVCSHCSKRFKTKNALTHHSETHTRTLVQCEVCSKYLSNNNVLAIHMRRHNQEYVTDCDICKMKFVSVHELKSHTRIKHGEKVLCSFCGKGFHSNATLIYHMKKHDPNFKKGTLKCDHCEKVFDRERNLKRHFRVAHDGCRKKYCCDLCGKVLTSLDGFKLHKLHHEGMRPLECETCGKRFLRKSTLRWHLRTHTGEKPHQCNFCVQAFTQPSALKRHLMGVHALKYPFICTICKSGFSTKILLNDHYKAKHPE